MSMSNWKICISVHTVECIFLVKVISVNFKVLQLINKSFEYLLLEPSSTSYILIAFINTLLSK